MMAGEQIEDDFDFDLQNSRDAVFGNSLVRLFTKYTYK